MDRADVPRTLRPSYLTVASGRKLSSTRSAANPQDDAEMGTEELDGYVGSASIAIGAEQNCEDQELLMTPHMCATSQSRRAPPGISQIHH